MSLIVIIISMVLLSAMFSGLEIAFVTSDKMMIELNGKNSKNVIHKILAEFTKKPSRFLATLLVGNNVALVTYGIYMDSVLEVQLSSFIENSVLILLAQTIISTLFIILFAEYLPKAIFRLKPNKLLSIFALPLYGLYWLLRWVVFVFVGFSKFILEKIFKMNPEEDPAIFGRMELEDYLENRTTTDEGSSVETEVQIYKNVLDFSNIRVRECMVPRKEIVALDINTSIDSLVKSFIDTGLSKILIYRDNIDDIIGFVHHFEMFKSPKNIKSALIPVGFIPSSMLAKEALNSFIKQHKSVLVVIDEFGGTAGMVTVEDVMEEIFGEIEDEHDVQEHTELTIVENQEYLFSGRMEIDFLNEKYNFEFPLGEEYETIAGYLFSHFESIPKNKAEFLTEKHKCIVEEVSETRIELVRVIVLQQEQ